MILSDYHTHTTYCDGANSPEEMILAAIDMGMTEIGFSAHSHTTFDPDYCLKKEETDAYINEIFSLKNKYKDKLSILCGVEQDYYSETSTDRFDYVIGSVHYLKSGENLWPVDLSAEVLSQAVRESFDGDWYLMAEHYYSTVSYVVEKTNADIIGHLDLITKFNETHNLFDATNGRYISAAKKCIDKLIPLGKPFEINTGAISRGYRTTPYPSLELIDYIKKQGGRLILSSDSHSARHIAFEFDKWEHLLV